MDGQATDKKEETKATQPAAEGAPKPKREKKPKAKKEGQTEEQKGGDKAPQYRVKGAAEKKEEGGDAKPRPQTADDGAEGKPKKKRAPKKKDAGEGEETKGEGDAAAKPRAQTAKPKYRKKGEADEAGEEGDTPKDGEETKGGDKPKEPVKNLVYQNPMEFVEKRTFKTKWDEYRHGDWRKGSGKTYVTVDTAIPDMPTKMLKLPDEKAFHNKQQDIEQKIKDIGTSLDEKKDAFDTALSGKKAAQATGGAASSTSAELKEKFNQMKTLKAKRQKIYDAQDEATKGQAELISKKEQLMQKIDRNWATTELVPKGIKDAEKKLATGTGGRAAEAKAIKQIELLKASLGPIKEKEAIDTTIRAQNDAKKAASTGLPAIQKEVKALQAEIDVLKADQSSSMETKESFDKQLDDINEKRKSLRDKREKLFKEKEQLRDDYYGSMILYQKQQYLVQDIEWMTKMKKQIVEREEDKARRKKEYEERKERIVKEREERKQREEERKRKIEERKQREAENKRIREDEARQAQIDKLKQMQNDISSNSAKSNPMYDQIVECDNLIKFCQKSLNQGPVEESKEADGPEEKKTNKELDAKLKQGALEPAKTKAEKEKELFAAVGNPKQKKGKKGAATEKAQDKAIDFKLIKQFNNLKISAPLNEEDYAKTTEDLKELREALVYWGKIIQRQNKIKYIRSAKRICDEEEFTQQAKDEEKFIENEKQKFDGDNVAAKTTLKLDKLKIAQEIDKLNKQKASDWEHDDDDDELSDEEGVFRADDVVEDEDGQMQIDRGDRRRGKRGGAGVAGEEDEAPRPKGGPKKATRGAKKFSEIAKQAEAFPTLDREDDDEEEDDEVTPEGDAN